MRRRADTAIIKGERHQHQFFGQYERLLYLMVVHGHVPRKALVCSIKGETQALAHIREAVERRHIEPFTIPIKVDGRKRKVEAYQITSMGFKYLRESILPADQTEYGWVSKLNPDDDLFRLRSYIPPIQLIRYLQISATSCFMATMGASIRDVFAEEYDADDIEQSVLEEGLDYGQILDLDYLDMTMPDEFLTDRERQRAEPDFAEDTELIQSDQSGEKIDTLPEKPRERSHLSCVVRNAKRICFGDTYREAPVMNAGSDITFVNSHVVKNALAAHTSDPEEYRKDRMTGIVISPCKAALVYTSNHGKLNWRAWNYLHEERTLYNYTSRFSGFYEKNSERHIGIALIQSPLDLEKIYRPYLRTYEDRMGTPGNSIGLGASMDQFLLVPMDRHGQKNCYEFLMNDVVKFQREAKQAALSSGMKHGPVEYRTLFELRHPDESLISIGLFMDVIRMNGLLQYQYSHDGHFGIMCYRWQMNYYRRLFPDAYYLVIEQRG